jgi:CRISPR system Cascade subunit CasE
LLGESPDEKRTFMYRADLKPEGLEILLLSEKAPKKIPQPWVVGTKAFEPKLKQGQLLGFRMRISPTYDKARAGLPSQRQDLVMSCYTDLGGEVSLAAASQIAAERWLDTRAEPSGFRRIEVMASGYTRHVMQKKDNRLTVPMLDLDGMLEVTDPDLFVQRLGSGFGKAKFAGCGMMLVRPACA